MRPWILSVGMGVLSVASLARAQVQIQIDSSQDRSPISPYIYGTNFSNIPSTISRSGGNRMTGYNWEENFSNAGSDYYHHSDYFLTGGPNSTPGAAISPMLGSNAASGKASIVTIPMAGYVSADANGTVDETEIAPSSRWNQVVAKKDTIYPGSPFSLNPNTADDYVFSDELVNWVENARQGGQQVFYSLDNEPGLWGEELPDGWQSGVEGSVNPSPQGRTHPTIHPFRASFTEMRDKTIAHATAIKDVNPDALVFGGVGYGWHEFRTLQDAPDFNTGPAHPGGDENSGSEMHYYEYLLDQVRQAEIAQGRKLMDVLDLHWYPEASGNGIRITGDDVSAAVVAARVQAVRSLWDPTYTESSWITQFSTLGPIKLLPRLQRDIDDFNPGTKIAITEYNWGASNHISGGIAQADFLGAIGREGVFAANFWDLNGGTDAFVAAAMSMYLNYDGEGSSFGDTSIQAITDDDSAVAVYASVDEDDPNRMIIVLINRTDAPLTAVLDIEHDVPLDHAEVFQLFGPVAEIEQLADLNLTTPNLIEIVIPAFSVTTLNLVPEPAALGLLALTALSLRRGRRR